MPLMHLYTSGKRVDLNNFKPGDVDLMDIAHNLAVLPRFAGNTSRPYSVLEHSVMVMQMTSEMKATPDVMMQALLHDATEAYIGDIPAPVKTVIPEIADFEKRLLWPSIATHFGIDVVMDPIVKAADWTAFFVEAKCLCFAADLEEWEGAAKYLPLAEKWIEANKEIPSQEMPHPGMMQKIFVDCYESLDAAMRPSPRAWLPMTLR